MDGHPTFQESRQIFFQKTNHLILWLIWFFLKIMDVFLQSLMFRKSKQKVGHPDNQLSGFFSIWASDCIDLWKNFLIFNQYFCEKAIFLLFRIHQIIDKQLSQPFLIFFRCPSLFYHKHTIHIASSKSP